MLDWYPASKVYFDGSHYLAVPHTVNAFRRRRRYNVVTAVFKGGCYEKVDPVVERYGLIDITDDDKQLSFEDLTLKDLESSKAFKVRLSRYQAFNRLYNQFKNDDEELWKQAIIRGLSGLFSSEESAVKYVSTAFLARVRHDEFDRLYYSCSEDSRSVKEQFIFNHIRHRFETDNAATRFVKYNLSRQKRNYILRRMRFVRKAYNHDFNYFVTLTYDDKKHTEYNFRRKLTYVLNNFSARKGWRYMGVWERGNKTNRLHFHGLFYIPAGTLSGKLEVIEDYNYKRHTLRSVTQNTFFLDRFGRNEFEELDNGPLFGHALAYIMKYLEKTGESIVYSRGLYQYFKSDIDGNDVVARAGREGRKLVLSDKFNCYQDGECLGQVSPETIMQLEKCM